MNVPKEVILDLLPSYLAGEISPVTQAWVEQYLEQDPAFAEQVQRQRQVFPNPAPALPLQPDLELRAFARTRRMLALLRWLFGLGIGFTATAAAVEISFRPLRFRLLMLDYPSELLPVVALGLACWAAYFVLRSRLRAT
jgi:anti-sigma factor RsiW